MRFRTLTAAMMALGLSACGAAEPSGGPATDESIAALAMPEPQFRRFLTRVIFTTTTTKIAMAALGVKANCDVLRPAFERAVADNLPAWRDNLIEAYRQNVPADVLNKAATAGPVAGAALIAPHANAIGAAMQAKSEPVLKAAAAAVITPLFEASAKVDSRNVDMGARRQELLQAQADGSILCGLQ